MSCNIRFLPMLAAVISWALTAPVFTNAMPSPDYAADARQSSDNPPLIPHAVKPDQNGEVCNVCHREGVKHAPPTDHPERLNCMQCHVQGEVKKGAAKDRNK